MDKDGFIAYVKSSKLSDEDKELWGALFGIMDDQHFTAMADFVAGNEENLKFITDNIKLKELAFAGKNKADWKKIYGEEKEYLAKYHE